MKNKIKQSQYGGELSDDDFDYTMDVDVNDLVNYLKGGNLPKAQLSYDLNNPPTLGEYYGFTYPSVETPTLDPDFYKYKRKQPTDYFASDKSLTDFINKRKPLNTLTFNQPVSNESTQKFSELPSKQITFGEQKLKKDPKERVEYRDKEEVVYDPYKIYEPSNQRQYQALFSPYLYNVGKAFDPNLQYPTKTYTEMPLRQYSIGPNYMALNEADAKLRQAINEMADTGSRRLNTLIGTSMQIAKQKGEFARAAEAANLAARKEYDLAKATQQKELDAARDYNRLQRLNAMLTQEGFKSKIAEQTGELQEKHAQFLKKEKEDRIKQDMVNLASKDYDVIFDNKLNKMVIKHNKSGFSMPYDDYVKLDTDRRAKIDEQNKKAAEEKTAATEASIKAKEEQDYKLSPEYKKYQDWLESQNKNTTGTKKYGGWIKENQPIKKRRNRLYY